MECYKHSALNIANCKKNLKKWKYLAKNHKIFNAYIQNKTK